MGMPKMIAIVPLAEVAFLMCLAQPCSLHAVAGTGWSAPHAVSATDTWQKEFDDICSKTQDAMTYSTRELTDLIRRCDALLPELEKLDETQKKVYIGRLRMCRGLYAYVLESKKNDSSANEKK